MNMLGNVDWIDVAEYGQVTGCLKLCNNLPVP